MVCFRVVRRCGLHATHLFGFCRSFALLGVLWHHLRHMSGHPDWVCHLNFRASKLPCVGNVRSWSWLVKQEPQYIYIYTYKYTCNTIYIYIYIYTSCWHPFINHDPTWWLFMNQPGFVCGSRTGARQIPPDAVLSSSCFSLFGVACSSWASGMDLWRRVLRKLATHHEPAHCLQRPQKWGLLPLRRALRWVDLRGGGYWGLDGCAWGPVLWDSAGGRRQWWLGGRWWKRQRVTTGLACKKCRWLQRHRQVGTHLGLNSVQGWQFDDRLEISGAKGHRPQVAPSRYWLHGKGRSPCGRYGEQRPTANHCGARLLSLSSGCDKINNPLNIYLFEQTTAV